MKLYFVANECLASALKDALTHYFDQPDVTAIDFIQPYYERSVRQLAAALSRDLRKNPDEQFIFLTDTFGSTADHEVRLLLARSGLAERSVVVSGMNLPLAIKYYGLAGSFSFEMIHDLAEDAQQAG
ncbi:PTS sugar transporter subunit IIA [Mitsuokella sp. WILCCON 0060]|uniref:PTS sugar transporter subunit IIA n=1 Tax=Mitsuokella sp. WILCCON 0060 TaxID=3345341 RepID=UPI003F1E13BD